MHETRVDTALALSRELHAAAAAAVLFVSYYYSSGRDHNL